MKKLRSAILVILGLLACGRTQAADLETRETLTPRQIEELVSPIALYPDPLVGLILPAATRPSDIVLAARFLERGGNPDQATSESWDDSVKALVRYREVLVYLDDNLAWTRSLGECFLDQPDAVMDAIQMVRARARAAGLLKDTPEQAVIVESDEIRIVPANPTVIYVPRYDPGILYYSSYPYYYSGPYLTFGIGYGVGFWLNHDCDWHFRVIRIAHRPDGWYHRPDWRGHHPDRPFGATAWTRWTPPPRRDSRFDRPPHNPGIVPRPDRPRGLSDATPFVAPSARPRTDARPDPRPNVNRPEAPRGVEARSQPRSDRISPHRESSVALTPPAANPVSARVSPPRIYNEAAASPRREHANPPSARPAPAYTPPAPRASAPPPERSRPGEQARPTESRNDEYDNAPSRSRGGRMDHRQLN